MKALLLELKLISPALFMDVNSGDPNSAASLEYIPGSALRGALIGAYLRETGNSEVDAADPEFRDLFLNEKVFYLHAYPMNASGQRLLPTPFSFQKEKDSPENEVWDFSVEDEKESGKTWQRVNIPFCSLNQQGKLALMQPLQSMNIHISRADRQQVTRTGSTVFRYQALSAGQSFQAVILSDEHELLQKLAGWAPENASLFLGKSRQAGYGRVRISSAVLLDNWEEYSVCGDDQEELVLTLLSDALLRDPLTGAFTSDICRALSIEAALKTAFIQTVVTGGFNRKWNLPLPQAQALKAGSLWVFQKTSELEEKLKGLQKTGIGERTQEGYGRIALNWHAFVKMEKIDYSEASQQTGRVELTAEEEALAQSMLQRLVKVRLEQALIGKIVGSKLEKAPENHQLSRLRNVLKQVLISGDIQLLKDFMGNMKSNASEQFKRARIEKQSLYDWLESWITETNPKNIWEQLDQKELIEHPPVLGGVSPDFKSLELDYTVRLINGVVQNALNLEKEVKNGASIQ